MVGGGNRQAVQEIGHDNLSVIEGEKQYHGSHSHSVKGDHIGDVEDHVAGILQRLQ